MFLIVLSYLSSSFCPIQMICGTEMVHVMMKMMDGGNCPKQYCLRSLWLVLIIGKWKHQSLKEMCSLLPLRYLLSAVVDTLWVKLETFFGWRCHVIPVVTPLLYPAHTRLDPPSSFRFVCFLTSCRCICHTPFFQLSSFFLSFSVLALCLKPTHFSQSLKPQNSTPLSLPSSHFMFYPYFHPSIHPSPPPLSRSLSPSH